MKKSLLFCLSFCLSASLFGQVASCDDGRYELNVFENVQSTLGLQFGQGETIGGVSQDLFLDVFEPEGDDPEVRRPVLILAFGGSFIGGERSDMHFMAEAYARKGYVTVAIDYRLYDLPLLPLPTEAEMIEVVVRAVGDMKAAVRFMREDAATEDRFKIDSDRIIVGGISAGAIVAAHTAVLDESDPLTDEIQASIDANGGLEGNTSDNFEFSSEVQALLNLSGGLATVDLISPDDPPIFSVHDEFDEVVPYGADFATVFGQPIIFMEGSRNLQIRADELGIRNELITIEGSTIHVSYIFDEDSTREIFNNGASFSLPIACNLLSSSDDRIKLDAVSINPNPNNGIFQIAVDQQVNVKAEMYDHLGRRVLQIEDVGNIDARNIDAGHYYIKLIDVESGAFNTLSFIKI